MRRRQCVLGRVLSPTQRRSIFHERKNASFNHKNYTSTNIYNPLQFVRISSIRILNYFIKVLIFAQIQQVVGRTQSSPTSRYRFWTCRNSSSRSSIAVRPAADACTQRVLWVSREPFSSRARGRWWCIAARFRTRSTPLLSCVTSTWRTLERREQMWRSLRPNELLTRLECRRTSGHSIMS